ncbi:MAG TPA: hypothetical protein VGO93_09410 [Candidatus Xenobia bacterium]|jgi:hypothetical protein
MSRNVFLTSVVWSVSLAVPAFAGVAVAPELSPGSMGGAVAVLIGALLLARETRPRP